MFREPEVTESKAATKADPSAPARSAIRRQRTVRPRDHAISSRPYRASASLDRRSLLDVIHHDRDNPNPNPDATVLANADLAHAEASNRLRLENGRALLRDAQSYERPGQRMRIPRNSALHHPRGRGHHLSSANSYPVPVDGALDRDGYDSSRLSPPRAIPTPPYTSGEQSSRSSPATNATTAPLGSASLTSRFAPAFRFDEYADGSGGHAANGPEVIPMSASRQDANENPPSRRVDHRSITESIRQENVRASRRRGAHVDGLGDRERSFSPEDESWATLLTTIPPDEHLPSASSSFTSATASASAASLSSNSASSSNTALTALSMTSDQLETLTTFPICDMSDSDDDSDGDSDGDSDHSETGTGTGNESDDWDMEDEEEERAIDDEEERAIDVEEGPAVDDYEDIPTHNVEEYSAALRARTAPIDIIVDEAFEQAGLGSLRTAEPATIATLPIQEMPHMRAVIEQLARRRDVPDEWWSDAGLTRNVGGLRDRMRELMERLDRLEVQRLEMERQREVLRQTELEGERDRVRERAARRAERAQRQRGRP